MKQHGYTFPRRAGDTRIPAHLPHAPRLAAGLRDAMAASHASSRARCSRKTSATRGLLSSHEAAPRQEAPARLGKACAEAHRDSVLCARGRRAPWRTPRCGGGHRPRVGQVGQRENASSKSPDSAVRRASNGVACGSSTTVSASLPGRKLPSLSSSRNGPRRPAWRDGAPGRRQRGASQLLHLVGLAQVASIEYPVPPPTSVARPVSTPRALRRPRGREAAAQKEVGGRAERGGCCPRPPDGRGRHRPARCNARTRHVRARGRSPS